MATLVLSAVGTAIGGPIGGAVGALIGRSVDARIFRPATRAGPRLSELAVQTSSYGTQIPKLFGTMRVAGTVIWSTDLIETRSTSGGSKGQPSTARYSYSASFAVLLSARAIRRVGRIWAEGKLLRGAAGDFKARTGFRLYLGGEDQPVDPLIASLHPDTPAHRGCAYAVFEGLHLADYGNRIPSLTFEVIADEGAVSVGAVAMALADEVDADVAQPLDGYAAAGASVAGVLDNLAMLGGAWWQPTGARIAMRDGGAAAIELTDGAIATARKVAPRMRTVAGIDTVPRTLSVAHYDPARDYQTGVQQAVRPGAGHRADRIELPAVLTAEAARGIAERALVEAEQRRTRRIVSAGLDAIGLLPGSVVGIAGESGSWRAMSVSIEAFATRVELEPIASAPIVGAVSSGAALPAPDRPVGATMLVAHEMPPIDDVALATPRISVMATGIEPGWRGAALLYSMDDGGSWQAAGGIGVPSIIGTVVEPPGDAYSTLVDEASSLVVDLVRSDMDLEDADANQIALGHNLALVGDELLQFGRARPLGGARWRLSQLTRGIRGTEWAAGEQASGDRFVLIDRGAMTSIDVPMDRIGATIRLLATGTGDVAGPATGESIVTGASVVPPAPVHAAMIATGDGGARIGWTRRSRLGWTWTGGIDVPLVEERERYEVTISHPDSGTERHEVDQPTLTLATAPPSATRIDIRQLGTHGASVAAIILV